LTAAIVVQFNRLHDCDGVTVQRVECKASVWRGHELAVAATALRLAHVVKLVPCTAAWPYSSGHTGLAV